MTKKMVLAVVGLMMALGVFADEWTDPSTGLTWTYQVWENGSVSVGGGDGTPAVSIKTSGTIVIPTQINGKTVTGTGYMSFWRCSELTEIIIPAGVTRIGCGTFERCSGLVKLVLPMDAEMLGDPEDVFGGCTALRSVTAPPEVFAMSSCGRYTIEEVQIPKGVSEIKNNAFESYSKLRKITLPDGLVQIGSAAFCRCSELSSINIPDSLVSVGESAFYGCERLGHGVVIVDGCVLTVNGEVPPDITLPTTTKRIFDYAFRNSTLQSIEFPEGVTSVGCNAFENCKSLRCLSLPNSLTLIGEKAFKGCEALNSIEIGASSIGICAFQGCTSLSEMYVHSSVSNIGNSAFYGCDKLRTIYVDDMPGEEDRIRNLIVNSGVYVNPSNLKVIRKERNSVEFDVGDHGTCIDVLRLHQDVAKFGEAMPPAVIPHEGYAFVRWDGEYCGIESNVVIRAIYVSTDPLHREVVTTNIIEQVRDVEHVVTVCETNLVDVVVTNVIEQVHDVEKVVTVYETNMVDIVATNIIEHVHDVENVVTVYETNLVDMVVTNTLTNVVSETVYMTNVVEQVLDVENFITVYATNVVEQFVTVEVTNYVEAVGADSSVVSDEVQSYEPQAGFDGMEKETYNGIAYDADGKLCGLVQITTAKADKKGAVRVGGFLMLQDGKKQTLKSATGKIDEGYVSVVSSVGKLGPVIVVIGADGFRGAIGDMSIVSADTSEGAGIVKGSLTVSYFDAKTNKLKTKTAKVAGVKAEGMASGTVEVKKEGVKEFAAEVQ